LPTLIGHDGWITGLAINADGSRLVSGSHDGTAIVWDMEAGQRLFTLSDGIGRVNSVDFSPDGKMLATATENTSAYLWDAVTGQRLATLVGHAEGNIGNVFDGVVDIEFSPGGARVATAGADGMAKVWDVETGAELISFMGHPEGYGLTVVTFSPDGTLLAIGTDYGQEASSIVKVLESSSGQELYTIVGQERIWNIDFSPDGNRLGIVDRSGVVSMWTLPQREDDTEIGDSEVEQLFSVPVHSSSAEGLQFTPDGKQIVTAGEDGKLSFRDSWTGEPLLTIDRPIGLGETVISPDGKWLAAAGNDGRVYIYVLDFDMLLSLAQSRLTRSLTTAECQQYLHMPECPES
jgi:WD40 repeat protein